MKKHTHHVFHRDTCGSQVRATISYKNNRISLMGQHAFEWSVVKEDENNITITSFSSRREAIKEFNKLKSIYYR